MMIQSVYEKDTLLVVGSFILVTFLQRIMENRKLLERAETALQRLSGDRRMVCVIALNLSVIKVLLFIIALSIVVYRLNPKEVGEFAKTSVEWRIIFNTIILMMFKNILTYTGAIGRLPDLFDGSAIPQFAAFGIIMFFGTIISGANSMIVLLIPLAFASIPNAGAGTIACGGKDTVSEKDRIKDIEVYDDNNAIFMSKIFEPYR